VSEIEARRAANRAAFPSVAAVVDEFREAFGDDVRVLGGVEIATGASFGPVEEAWAGCVGCGGERPCDHPQRATSFCGYRSSNEMTHAARLWVESGFPRLRAAR